MSVSFDIVAAFRAELAEHRRHILEDVQRIVEVALKAHATETLMDREQLAAYCHTTVPAMNTAWCRARKKGGQDALEACAIEVNGTKRWRRQDVDAVLALKK